MEVLSILGVILLLSFMVETLVEFLAAPLVDNVPALGAYHWVQEYIAIAVGILGAFVYSFDLLYLLGSFVGASIPLHPFGIALTGIAVGKGANYLHDLIGKYFVKPSV